MSHCYSISNQQVSEHRAKHSRSVRRQATPRLTKFSGNGGQIDQHPDGGEWSITNIPALITSRKCNGEHSNLKHPTEFEDNLLAN